MNQIEYLFTAGDFSKETGFKEVLGRRLFGSAGAFRLSEAEIAMVSAAGDPYLSRKNPQR